MKKAILAILAAGTCTAAMAQTALTQDGYSLKAEYTVPSISNTTDARAGVGVNDKFFVDYHATGIKVFDKDGNLETTIAPTAGYHFWTGISVDDAGNVIARVDTKAFDGTPSVNPGHGYMVIDSKTNQTLFDFLPMGGGYPTRCDALANVSGDITKDAVRVFLNLSGGTNCYMSRYDKGTPMPTYAFASKKLADFAGTKAADQTNTGYLREYKDAEGTLYLGVYTNPEYTTTYSGDGMYGNAIQRFVLTDDGTEITSTKPYTFTTPLSYFNTPMHNGITGFNLFSLGGKDYIIYPAMNPASAKNQDNRPADAFAIAEVQIVDSPVTDINALGETLVDGKPAGNLVAIFPGTSAIGAASCIPSFNVEAIEGDENSVYIYVFGSGAPGYKWKFTVGESTEEPDPEQPVEPAPDPQPAQSLLTRDGVSLTQVYTLDASVTAGSRTGVGMNDHIYVTAFSDETSAGAVKVYNAKGELVNTVTPVEGFQIWPATNVDAAGNVLVQMDKASFLPNATPSAWTDSETNPQGYGHALMVMESEFNEVLVDKIAMGGGYPTRYDGMARVAQNIMTDYNTRVMAVLSGNANTYQNSYNQTAGQTASYWKVAGFNTSEHLVAFQAVEGGAAAATAQTTTGLAGEYRNADGGLELAVYTNYTYKSTYSDANFYGNPIAQFTGAGNYKPTGKYFYTPMHANMPGFTVFTLGGKQYVIYPANSIANRASRLGDAFVITEVTYVDSPLTDIEAPGEKFVGEGTINPESPVVAYFAGAATGNAANSNIISYSVEPIFGQDNSAFIYVYCAGAPVTKWRFTVGNEEELPAETLVINKDSEGGVTAERDAETSAVTVTVPYTVSDALVGRKVEVKVDGEHYDYFTAEAAGNYTTVMNVEDNGESIAKNIQMVCRSASDEVSLDVKSMVNVIVTDENAPVEYYNMLGVRVQNPANGVYIVKQGNKTTKVVL